MQMDRNRIVRNQVNSDDKVLFSFHSPQGIELIAWQCAAEIIRMHDQSSIISLGFRCSTFGQRRTSLNQKMSEATSTPFFENVCQMESRELQTLIKMTFLRCIICRARSRTCCFGATMIRQGDNGMPCSIVLDFRQSQQHSELERDQLGLNCKEMDAHLFLVRVLRLKEDLFEC
jgi:hypothetical protein